MASSFKQGEQFNPRYPGHVGGGEIPFKGGEKIMNLNKLALVFGMSVSTVGQWAES